MNDSQTPIARNRVFVLLDGSFVLRLDEQTVEELLTGRQRHYERREFGANITDFELNQLRQAGIVSDYDREQVWLTSAEQRQTYYQARKQSRVRTYYLHTTHDPAALPEVTNALAELGLSDALVAMVRDDFVVIEGAAGRNYGSFDEVEAARCELTEAYPDLFADTVVAFVEVDHHD